MAPLWQTWWPTSREMAEIPFTRPHLTGGELASIAEAIDGRRLGGAGRFTQTCRSWLERRLGCARVSLTHSCTAALEMAALLIGIEPGDEVIMPSYTFSSTANAVVLRGATPVFADCVSDTMNIDVDDIEALITPATKAIMPVHYAGRPPDMDRINAIADAHGLIVIEDAAQSLGSTYKGAPAGTHSHLAAISFHETKNVVSGEGGALIISDPCYVERAAILREKGTNRAAFMDGLVDKYTWVDVGSSYLPSELVAAFLAQQLEATDSITKDRLRLWRAYRDALGEAADTHGLILPARIDADAVPNGHIFHVLLANADQRAPFLNRMKEHGIQCSFHYVPLHTAPAGKRFGRAPLGCPTTEDAAARLVRLPLFAGMGEAESGRVVEATLETLKEIGA